MAADRANNDSSTNAGVSGAHPRMIKVAQAAERVGLSKSQMNKLRCLGGGPPFYKLGASVFYREDDIDAWLAERRRTSTWNPADSQK